MTERPGKVRKVSSAHTAPEMTGPGAAGAVAATVPAPGMGKSLSPRRRAGLRHTTPPLPEPCSEPFKILASLISVAERFKTDLGTLRPEYPQVAEVIHFLDITQLSAEQVLPGFAPPPGAVSHSDPKV